MLDEIYGLWKQRPLPPDPRGTALVSFTLGTDGAATDVTVESENDALAREAQHAIGAAAPFPPLVGPLACLAGARMNASFRLAR